DDLAVIALNSAKPGRAETQCWVAHASPSWSAAHLELEFPQIAALMLPKLCAQIGAQPDQAIHVAAHRWRYARVVTAIGQPFLRDLAGSLYAGGDWCLGADADHAWQSGVAIARDILDHA
ncbi:MAG: deoxyribodipyrimidine photolyase, partial [Mangrovicoccus sp.]|nr:deoxyribodipyrimidine photolyase [Mangrovicoccus sp.]